MTLSSENRDSRRHDDPAPALNGVRILDLSMFLAGPFCTQQLADLGAEIIKIEPKTGDSTRVLPPHFHNGESLYFLSANRSKKGMVLDLSQTEGREILYRLAANADVVVDNFRPGVTRKLGVDFATLSEINPRIICCSISGYGQDGPYAKRPAYDMIVQALSGGMSLTGEPGARAVRAGIPIGDICAGLHAVIGILAALREREQSGKGQFIDISMLDVQVAMLSYQGVYHLFSGDVPGRQGRGHASIPTYASFEAADGDDVLICANTEKMWQALCDVLELPELPADPRFVTNELRHANRDALEPLLTQAFAGRTRDDWLARLNEKGVPCAPVNSVADALADPQVRHRDMVHPLTHHLGGEIEVLGNPIKLSRSPCGAFRSPPLLGQHTEEIMRELAYAADEIGSLRARGVIA
ncbi:CaiB/BaiF CoA transferase family protein [Caballeronia glebae]|uniref:CaiB/BaiF CoA transferase family protein n=1 Tax=Caballeronia glebae TaxID=1777143 RepID=UPI0038B6ED3A